MPFLELTPDATIDAARGDVVVCVPVFGGFDVFAQCLASVLTHTDPEAARILICDDASVDPKFRGFVRDTVQQGEWSHEVRYLRRPVNEGFVESVNAALRASAPADVIVLNSDCIVSDGWLAGMRDAAYSDSRVATATALTNAGTIVSVPTRNVSVPQLPQHLTAEGVADSIVRASLGLHPDLPTCIGHCVYLRRSALELVGLLDTAFSPGYGEEVDFSQRCVVHGLRHVLADAVFVYHRHGGSFGHSERVQALRREHDAIVASRYPYYEPWVAEVAGDSGSPLSRSLLAARSAILGLSVTIDGRCLTPVMTGTSLATVELVAALSVYTDVNLRVLVPPDLGDYAAQVLAKRSIEPLSVAEAATVPPTDIVHRPFQISSPEDVLLLRRLGERMIITHLDSIAYRNPAYFEDFPAWKRYRELTDASLAAADQVVFISRHAARDARSLGLVEEGRINVAPLGTDHILPGLYPDQIPPARSGELEQMPFLFVLGTDFLHKNRPFALRLLEALLDEGMFDGRLVFAGPRVGSGSSAGLEASYLASRPRLADRVLDLAAVAEPEKQWLLAHAAAVVYPTTFEGFGLIPFEAAQAGTPTLFAWNTSLADYLPESLALLVPWDAQESARRVAPVLADGQARTQHVTGVKMAGARLTASGNAKQHAGIYAHARQGPTPLAARMAMQALALQQERDTALAHLGEIYGDPLNIALVGQYAILPEELRRPVLAVASRPALTRSALALYRAAHSARARLSSGNHEGERTANDEGEQ
jgi:GT2 family glycosyltransferase